MKHCLPSLIHSTQTGFVNGRYIGENINILLHIIETAEQEQIPALVLSVDFEKAFDSLDWGYLFRILEYLEFGESFKKWVRLFHTKITSTININGWFTSYFDIGRGARQGDPISPYLFILCDELLGLNIRTNTAIHGIELGNTRHIISQFADDTMIYLNGEDNSLANAIHSLDEFAALSGLSVNYEKSLVFKIGKLRNEEYKYAVDRNLQWSNGPISTLGVKIPLCKEISIIDLNYNPKIKDLETVLHLWSMRQLTLYGRVTVVKSLALSKIQYLANVLPMPTPCMIQSITRLIYNFIWNRKSEKISREQMERSIEEGGLKVPNVELYFKTAKLAWVKRYLDSNNETWKTMVTNILKRVGGMLVFRGNFNKQDCMNTKIKSAFWKEILMCWSEANYNNTITDELLQYQTIWMNSNLKVQNELQININCIENELHYLGQLVGNNTFHDRDTLNDLYSTNLNPLEYNTLIMSIPPNWKIILKNSLFEKEKVPETLYSTLATKSPKEFKSLIYKKLQDSQNTHVFDWQAKWGERFPEIKPEVSDLFLLLKQITLDCKMQSFQFRILHKIVWFNDKLFKYGLSETSLCTFCNASLDSLEHRFWLCGVSQDIWKDIMNWYEDKFMVRIILNLELIIFNDHKDPLVAQLILLTKYHIYNAFIMKERPTFQHLMMEIQVLERTELQIAIQKMKITNHQAKWGPLSSM